MNYFDQNPFIINSTHDLPVVPGRNIQDEAAFRTIHYLNKLEGRQSFYTYEDEYGVF